MLRPAVVFSDHMVLQREKEIAVFGQADGEVSVSLGHYKVKAQSRQERFLVFLPPMEAGGPYTMTIRCGSEEIALQDVMIGEVFICGGQSNMEFRLRDDRDFAQFDRVSVPSIRFFETPPAATAEEAERMEAGRAWRPLEAGQCGDVSAVSFYAALEMEKKLQVPVGMLVCCLGGTSISCWISEETLASFEEGREYLTDFRDRIAGKSDAQYEQELREYEESVRCYNEASDALKKQEPDISFAALTEKIGDFPWPPPDGRLMLRRPGGLYENMLRRIAPYTARGFFFYQGETDSPLRWVKHYEKAFMEMMREWRALFKDETLFFFAAQLPRFGSDPQSEDWAALRSAQSRAVMHTERAALACLIDCGEKDNIHPVDKRTPGKRLAALALQNAYGLEAETTPCMLCARRQGDQIILLSGGTDGVRIRGKLALETEGAEISEAKAEGNTLRLRVSGHPVRIRYAWENFPEVSLFDENGLPFFPFDLPVTES